MPRAGLDTLDPRRLRRWLAVFFVALAVPSAVLIQQAYSRLKWEAFHQHRVLAEELTQRIDARAVELVRAEEARSFAQYAFLAVAGDPDSGFVQRSDLAAYPVRSAIPGLIGYFQVDADGAFSTPLLPPPQASPGALGIDDGELAQRTALAARLRAILGRNRLVQGPRETAAAPAAALAGEALRDDAGRAGAAPSGAAPAAQAAFDRLAADRDHLKKSRDRPAEAGAGRVDDLELDLKYLQPSPAPAGSPQAAAQDAPGREQRATRKERAALAQPRTAPAVAGQTEPGAPAVRIDIFESEVDPFELSLLDSGHFVLYRRVWRDGRRYIQGALIEQRPFVDGLVAAAFRSTALTRTSELIVAWQGEVMAAFTGEPARGYAASADELSGALLYRSALAAPLGDLELVFTIGRLPAGAGGTVLAWTAAILALVLCAGVLALYRLGLRQIALARQQQDFVSAVSHELKTPLTSIRMYGEMLREGWAAEERRQEYYDFIFQESERLSRLIANVLQLARMTRNELKVDVRPTVLGELLDTVRSRIATQVERAGFTLAVHCEGEAARTVVRVDADCFTQILINLVDNALKFAARAERRVIDVRCTRRGDDAVEVAVRDYGPGVAPGQMKKIFGLFYRAENELTRETVGTGIGLALVSQLAQAMDGRVDVVNRDPGAEFRVRFPAQR